MAAASLNMNNNKNRNSIDYFAPSKFLVAAKVVGKRELSNFVGVKKGIPAAHQQLLD